jgi:hypothetical protein
MSVIQIQGGTLGHLEGQLNIIFSISVAKKKAEGTRFITNGYNNGPRSAMLGQSRGGDSKFFVNT